MRVVVQILILMFVTPLIAAGEVLSFKNFSKTLQLQPITLNTNRYLFEGKELKSTNRLILKVSNTVSKKQLLAFDAAMGDIKELYSLKDSTYYSVTVAENVSLNTVVRALARHKEIYLIQPDLLQINQQHEQPVAAKPSVNYIEQLGISAMWDNSKGENVKLAIIDDGFDLSHEDLKHTTVAFQYDVQSQTLDASPRLEIDRHGTQVAGIIFAEHNNVGVDGIAPAAEFIAIRDTDTWTSNLLLGFNLAKLAGADIINCSWASQLLLEPVADVINDLAQNGRQGKGIAVVFSAGNEHKELMAMSSEATLASVIGVGSINQKGSITSFSNYGEPIQFYTLGQAILSTSRNPEKYKNFSGTSASAPIVSGLIALMLSQDKALSLNEIKQQLHRILVWN